MSSVKLTPAQAKALGLDCPRKGRNGTKKKQTAPQAGQALFLAACVSWGLPEPTPEYMFHFDRRWRFDWLFDGWLAVEQVGGVWVNGHHSRGQSQIDDMEKRNMAHIQGYTVLEFTPQQFKDGSAFAVIKMALEAE